MTLAGASDLGRLRDDRPGPGEGHPARDRRGGDGGRHAAEGRCHRVHRHLRHRGAGNAVLAPCSLPSVSR